MRDGEARPEAARGDPRHGESGWMIAALLLAAALDPAEVTNAQYRACVQARQCRPAAFEDPRSAANLKTGKSENAAAYRPVAGDAQPAVGVSWSDAVAFCRFSRKRLAARRDLGDLKPSMALWLADAAGKRRAVRGGKSRGAEDPSARAHWLSFRCATR